MKLFRIFFRNIKNAFVSIFRNFSLSIASITCTTITLTIVALAMLVSVNVKKFTKDVADTLTMIVFVDKDASQAEIDNIKSELLKIETIKGDELEYKSKERITESKISYRWI